MNTLDSTWHTVKHQGIQDNRQHCMQSRVGVPTISTERGNGFHGSEGETSAISTMNSASILCSSEDEFFSPLVFDQNHNSHGLDNIQLGNEGITEAVSCECFVSNAGKYLHCIEFTIGPPQRSRPT